MNEKDGSTLDGCDAMPLAVEQKTVGRRFGFLSGLNASAIPDDFDRMDELYIYQLFAGEIFEHSTNERQ